MKWLFVIARNSSFAYKGHAVDVKQVGRELGVRYVLEGSLRKAGDRIRITCQLIETANGTHVWAERYDRPLGNIFEVQDEITLSVVGAIEPSLRQAEIELAKRKRPDSLDAFYLRALPHAQVAMPGDGEKALSWLNKSLALEPDYAAAHAPAAWCYEQRYVRGGMHEADKVAALEHARAALAAAADDATTLATAGFVIGLVEHDYEAAMNAIDHALALNGSSALALGLGSTILAHDGRIEQAIEYGERALRLSPHDPTAYLQFTALGICAASAARMRPRQWRAGCSSWNRASALPNSSNPTPGGRKSGIQSATRCAKWACRSSDAEAAFAAGSRDPVGASELDARLPPRRRAQFRAAAALPAAWMIRMPCGSTRRCWPGKTTVVEPNSSTTAGPSSVKPAPSEARSNTGVSQNLPSK